MTRSRSPLVSRKEALILDLLAGAGEMYGLQMVEASAGALKRGTVYVTLGRMEERGYVSSRPEAPRVGAIGLPRRMYRLTPLGRRAHDAWNLVAATLAWQP